MTRHLDSYGDNPETPLHYGYRAIAPGVVYLQPAGNSDRPPIRYNTPFTTCVRGLCHGIPPRFLPAHADRPAVVVSHALLGVAIGARSRSTDTTHASDATPQTLHGAQTLPRSHPSTPLRRLCTGGCVAP